MSVSNKTVFDKKYTATKNLMSEAELPKNKQLISIVTLLATTGVMWFGFFMLIPLVAVHITRDLGMGAAVAGMVLAVRQMAQFGLGLFVSALADRAGYRRMILLGMLVRAAGFFWLAFATDVLTLVLSAAVSAVGGALFESSGKAALLSLSRGYKRETIFALSTTIGNIGMSLGPLAGVALLHVNFAVVGVVSACMYLVNYGLVWLFVPKVAAGTVPARSGTAVREMFDNLGQVWHNRPFVMITALLVGYFSLYSQINITLPLEATRLTNSEQSVSLLYIINSGLAITLQLLSLRYLSRWFNPVTIIGLGSFVSALGLLLIGFINSYTLLIGCVIIYALGRLIVEPVTAVLVSQYATEKTLASYFGFSSLAMGFGGVFGNLIGGWLFDYGRQIGLDNLCWWFFGLIGLMVTGGVFSFRRYELKARPAPLQTVSASPETDAIEPAAATRKLNRL